MASRIQVVRTLLLLCCVFSSSASSHPSGGVPIVVEDAPSLPFSADALTPAVACLLEPGPVTTVYYSVQAPGSFEHLAWRIPIQSCAACGPGQGLDLETVSVRIRWRGACTAQAEVSVIGVTGPPGCRRPDDANVLCGPDLHTLSGPGAVAVTHTLPVPAGCCVNSQAFVLVRFIDLGLCHAGGFLSPGLAATTVPCVSCDQYFSDGPSIWPTDWCILGQNSIWIEVGADCCSQVGVAEGSAEEATGIAVLESPSHHVRLALTLGGTERRPVEVDVFDIAGRRVRALLRADLAGGRHRLDWDGTSDAGELLPAGVYKVRLSAGSARDVATAVLLD
jgi:flagellar hook capping protein FlgD